MEMIRNNRIGLDTNDINLQEYHARSLGSNITEAHFFLFKTSRHGLFESKLYSITTKHVEFIYKKKIKRL